MRLNLPLYMLAGLLLATLTPQAEAAREVSDNRECATCHIMWLKEFNQKDAQPLIKYDPTPTVKTGKQDVASTERMCFSCHDGFVLDSRFLWKQGGHSHPVGVAPSDKVKIPTSKGKKIFPLNMDGKLYCGSCHSAHGVDWKDKESPIFLREKNVDSSLCISCHLNRSTGPEHGNHPIFKHRDAFPQELIKRGARFSRNGELICQSCHKPHAAPSEKILLKSNKGSSLCLSCHKDKKTVLQTKHNMGLKHKGLINSKGKNSEQGGPCSACHIPHDAEGPTLWARPVDKTLPDAASATCLSCHADKAIVKDKTVGVHSHPVGRNIKQLGIKVHKGKWSSEQNKLAPVSAPLPLFDKHGEPNEKGEFVSCASCHDPHVWSQKHSKDDKPLEEGDAHSSFLRISEGEESPLCLTCHLDKRSIQQSKHDLNHEQPPLISSAKLGSSLLPAANRKLLQASHEQHASLCTYCHTPHNAKGARLRARGEAEDQRPFESLCRDCHRQGGLADYKRIGEHSHPLGVHPKGLKPGSGLPLFDGQGQKVEQDGTLDCTTCHDPHRWSATGQAPSDNEGDGNNSFLRITTAGDAKLCRRCHQEKGTVLKTDHDLAVIASDSRNDLGQTVQDSGPCAQCHAVHNPLMKERLWARKAGEGQDVIERQCRSCHRRGGPAEAKVPDALEHPQRVTVWSEKARRIYKQHHIPEIKVFDQDGKEVESGEITCASCHEPHTWSADPAKRAGTGKNREGDAMSSFLRNQDTAYIVCGDCHGEDAIYRYKYFHSERSRIKHPLYK